MAKIDFVLQALTDRFHADELRKLLSKSDCKRVLVSVAFVRQDGVSALLPVCALNGIFSRCSKKGVSHYAV